MTALSHFLINKTIAIFLSPTARQLLPNMIWSLSGAVISRLMNFALMILVSRILGVTGFGELGAVQSSVGLFGLFAGAALGNTATRFIARAVKASPAETHSYFVLIQQMSLVMIALATLLLVCLAPLIGAVVFRSEAIGDALLIGAILMAATAFRGVYTGILAGFQRFRAIAWVNIAGALLALPIVMYLADIAGLRGVIIGLTLAEVLASLLAFALVRKDASAAKAAVNADARKARAGIGTLLSYSVPTLLANLVATPALWLCLALLAQSNHGLAAVGLYNAAYQWHGPVLFIPIMMMSAAVPTLVQLWEIGNQREFTQVTVALCLMNILIALPPLIIAALFISKVEQIYGTGFEGVGLLVLLLILAAPLHGICKVATASLQAMGRVWYIFGANMAWALALIAISWVAIPQQGALGLCFAFLAAYLILAIVALAGMIRTSRQTAAQSKGRD